MSPTKECEPRTTTTQLSGGTFDTNSSGDNQEITVFILTASLALGDVVCVLGHNVRRGLVIVNKDLTDRRGAWAPGFPMEWVLGVANATLFVIFYKILKGGCNPKWPSQAQKYTPNNYLELSSQIN